ncbi:MAG: 16S rRNA (cytosine(1402)-N(4))-methyltransferase RsmH [Candidatus Caenarcaniphilales bacterium]|nr:16S rRNA (cytosine(1402)-N(4))-methyltransferase RsmH [Candidatus Caenarcaniphilales bacterium]
MNQQHIPVMLNEVLEIFEPVSDMVLIDGTLGMAGHSKAILEKAYSHNSSNNGSKVQLFGFDRDPESLKLAEQNLLEEKKNPCFSINLINQRFSKIPDFVPHSLLGTDLKYSKKVILLDLGISSFQLDEASYGLNFSKEARELPLDMRLDEWCQNSASEILNTWPEQKIADMFWDYADYLPARKLAKAIVQNRPILTLGEIIELCFKMPHRSKIHPATLPLMALRIAVNEEFSELESGLEKIIEWMEPDTILAVISFHSGEDRIVKNIFKKHKDVLKLITPKPLTPTKDEIRKNSRARSAKLRAACKISHTLKKY